MSLGPRTKKLGSGAIACRNCGHWHKATGCPALKKKTKDAATPKFDDLRDLPCTHCGGSKVSKNGYDECPWCDGFGTYSMMLRVLEATGRLPHE